jgi:Asp-tRNA(Asn)/Glu-tRNA(Gln) amidotransferase A subunit family amidase
MAKELWQLPAAELGAGYSAGEFTPVDVFESVFRRIEKVNPSINAFVTIDEQAARRSAEESAKRWQADTAKIISPFMGCDRPGVVSSIQIMFPRSTSCRSLGYGRPE